MSIIILMFTVVSANCRLNSSIVYLSPILRLQSPQIGIRLFIVVFPPFDSGILCPTSKEKTVILRVHQIIGHFDENISPKCFSHTSSRNFFEIVFFLDAGSLLLPFSRVFDLNQNRQKLLI